MKDIPGMQHKLLHIAAKLGVSEELIGKMKDEFGEMGGEMKEGYHKMPDGSMMKDSDMPDGKAPVEIDISKKVVKRMPTEEDINKMEKDELISFAMKTIKEPSEENSHEEGRANGQHNSPFVVMMKKKGY